MKPKQLNRCPVESATHWVLPRDQEEYKACKQYFEFTGALYYPSLVSCYAKIYESKYQEAISDAQKAILSDILESNESTSVVVLLHLTRVSERTPSHITIRHYDKVWHDFQIAAFEPDEAGQDEYWEDKYKYEVGLEKLIT